MEGKDICKIWSYLVNKLQLSSNKVILTGTSALKILGLLDRDPKDLDFVVYCSNKDIAKRLIKRINSTSNNSRSYTFMKRGIDVDVFFRQEEINTIDSCFEGILIENPIDILSRKLISGKGKDLSDFSRLFFRAFSHEKISNDIHDNICARLGIRPKPDD